MADATDGLPVLPHLAAEFYLWLWWASDTRGHVVDLGGDVGRVDVWVDERLAFRSAHDGKVNVVLTGEDPAGTLEAKAALRGGKVLHEVRVGIRRDDREHLVTLHGPAVEIRQLKLPAGGDGGHEQVLFDRLFLYEEVVFVLGALYRSFAAQRSDAAWNREVLPQLSAWMTAGA
jgi:hypothetical protein